MRSLVESEEMKSFVADRLFVRQMTADPCFLPIG